VEDMDVFLKGMWFLDIPVLYLKPWLPMFDTKDDFYGSTPLWVKLPNIPMEFWFEPVVRDIGDILVNIILVDGNFLTSDRLTMVIFLMEIDINKIIFESMDLV
jgi:hypothetical protein